LAVAAPSPITWLTVTESASRQDIKRTWGSFSTRSSQAWGAQAEVGVRLMNVLTRISRQPSTVLIFSPSLLNSTSPWARAKVRTGVWDCSNQATERSPSSWQTRSIVSSDTVRWHISLSCALALSNDQLVPANDTIRRAPGVSDRLSRPAQASKGVRERPQPAHR